MKITSLNELSTEIGKGQTPQARAGTFVTGLVDLFDHNRSNQGRLDEIVAELRSKSNQFGNEIAGPSK